MLKKHIIRNVISLAVLLAVLLLSFIPVGMMIVMSLRNNLSIQFDFWALPRLPHWSNYAGALMYLTPSIARTLYVAIVSIAGITIFASVSAYAFARLRFFGREFLFYLVIIILLVPGVLTLTPNFILATSLGLRNSLSGLILFYIAGGQAFTIFMLRAFFQSQPEEMFEAARMDGASELRMVWSIAVPLAQPILITLGIMNFLTIYNDFIWPLLMLISRDLYTVTIILQSYGGNLSAAMAGYVVASVPILAIFAYGMDYYVEGLTSGAIQT